MVIGKVSYPKSVGIHQSLPSPAEEKDRFKEAWMVQRPSEVRAAAMPACVPAASNVPFQ